MSESRTKYTAQHEEHEDQRNNLWPGFRAKFYYLKLNEPLYVMSSPLGTGGAMSCNTGKWRGLLLLNGMTLEVLRKDKGAFRITLILFMK